MHPDLARVNAPIIYELPSILDRLEMPRLFNLPKPCEVELGSGDGSFLVEYAQRHPDHNFLGVERLLGRLRKVERKAQRAGLTNLRAVRIEASYLLQYLLPAHCACALHIYFPDPWPKRKHRRHRLVNSSFPALAHERLAERGKVFLRTDDADYFEQMCAVFGAGSLFRPVDTPSELAGVITDFESGFQARGIETLHAGYESIPG
jgi:tRNA (guanine-N7-)-methyltransferase